MCCHLNASSKRLANFQLKNIHNYKWRHKYLNTKLVPPLKILFYTCIVWKTLPVQVFWRHFSMRRVRRLKNEARQIGGGGFILSDTMYECVSKPDYLPCHRRRGSEKLHTRDVMYECSIRGTHTHTHPLHVLPCIQETFVNRTSLAIELLNGCCF